jgi:hypothetical protein
VPVDEPRVRALHAAVGELDRREELRLQPVRVALVELVVGRAKIRERVSDQLDGPAEGVEQFLSRLGARIGHLTETSPAR